MAYTILLALLVAIILIIFKRSIYKKSRSSLPPGPIGLPIIGCLFQMLMCKPAFRWIHKLMENMNTEIACINLGRVHVITITSPKLARKFLKEKDGIFASRPDCMSARLSSNGYLTTVLSPTGEQWKKMRRVLATHVLSPAMHHWLHHKRSEEADNLIRYVYNQFKNSSQGGGLINIRIVAQQYCGNVIRRMIFNKRYFGEGTKDGGPGPEEEEHVAAIFRVHAFLYSFGVADYFPWLEFFDLDGHKGMLNKTIETINKFHDPEIHTRTKAWKTGAKEKEDDLLDVLINLKDSSNGAPLLTTAKIKAQIIEIMLATVDNPSNAIEWAIAEMINQPMIFKKALEELDRVVGKDRLVQESDMKELNYVKACAREAFRLHPVAPFNVPHLAMEDTTIDGYSIPKGSNVLLSRLGLNRNPRIWDEPLKYKPERHLEYDGSEVVLFDNELNMLSFSIGRRGCAGIQLGSTMTTMLFARLIQGFTWNAPPDVLNIDLTESQGDLSLAKPLLALAKPRLSAEVYQQLGN